MQESLVTDEPDHCWSISWSIDPVPSGNDSGCVTFDSSTNTLTIEPNEDSSAGVYEITVRVLDAYDYAEVSIFTFPVYFITSTHCDQYTISDIDLKASGVCPSNLAYEIGIGAMNLDPQDCFTGDPIYQTCWQGTFTITPTPTESNAVIVTDGVVAIEPTQSSSAGTYQIDLEAQYAGTTLLSHSLEFIVCESGGGCIESMFMSEGGSCPASAPS